MTSCLTQMILNWIQNTFNLKIQCRLLDCFSFRFSLFFSFFFLFSFCSNFFLLGPQEEKHPFLKQRKGSMLLSTIQQVIATRSAQFAKYAISLISTTKSLCYIDCSWKNNTSSQKIECSWRFVLFNYYCRKIFGLTSRI